MVGDSLGEGSSVGDSLGVSDGGSVSVGAGVGGSVSLGSSSGSPTRSARLVGFFVGFGGGVGLVAVWGASPSTYAGGGNSSIDVVHRAAA